jgi:phosphate-selective porin OprO/OprP
MGDVRKGRFEPARSLRRVCFPQRASEDDMIGKTFWLATTSLSAALMLATPAAFAAKEPAASGASNQELIQRIERLENKMQQTNETNGALRTRLSTLEQDVADPHWAFSNGRPTISSGDGRFSLAIRTRFQTDVASFMQDDNLPATVVGRDLSSGAVVRRAYLGIEGRSFKDFWYEFRLNFGGTNAEGAALNLARIAYVGIPNFRINLGIIQPIFTYGNTVSSGQLTFIERAEAINIATDNFGGEDARRGVELTFQKTDFLHPGDNFLLSGSYTGAVIASATGHGAGGDEQSQMLGRFAYRLWSDGVSNLQIGASAANLLHLSPTTAGINLQDRPEIRIDGTQLVSTGAMTARNGTNMWGVDAEFNINRFFMAGEYMNYNVLRAPIAGVAQADAEFKAWYVEASFVLAGASKVYGASAMNNEYGSWGAPRVSAPFSLAGGTWGGWELAARYAKTDLDHNEGIAGAAAPLAATGNLGVRGGESEIVTLGLNWYLNNNVRIALNDLFISTDRLNAAGARAGQDLNVVAARFQFQM